MSLREFYLSLSNWQKTALKLFFNISDFVCSVGLLEILLNFIIKPYILSNLHIVDFFKAFIVYLFLYFIFYYARPVLKSPVAEIRCKLRTVLIKLTVLIIGIIYVMGWC